VERQTNNNCCNRLARVWISLGIFKGLADFATNDPHLFSGGRSPFGVRPGFNGETVGRKPQTAINTETLFPETCLEASILANSFGVSALPVFCWLFRSARKWRPGNDDSLLSWLANSLTGYCTGNFFSLPDVASIFLSPVVRLARSRSVERPKSVWPSAHPIRFLAAYCWLIGLCHGYIHILHILLMT